MFIHRMALELHMTVTEIKKSMPASELFDWIAYWQRLNEGSDTSEMSAEDIQKAFGA